MLAGMILEVPAAGACDPPDVRIFLVLISILWNYDENSNEVLIHIVV